jgi:hypothetical protein
MEFLDPAAKKARTIRLFTGYALLAVVVALATTILVYRAQGFGYDRNKGVTRNGLLFIDAKPESAAITLDGKQLSDKTNARITVAEGEHSVSLNIDKYREWTKKFTVDGGAVKYLLYPRLFPRDMPLSVTRTLPQNPAWAKQSPDRHWLVYQQKADAPVLTMLDILKPTEEPKVAVLPSSVLLTQAGKYGVITPLEWADDNKHLLLLQTLPDGAKNYIQLSRENPDESISVTKVLKLSTVQTVVLRDKKYDKFYIHTASTGEIRNGNTKSATVSEPFVTGVVAFKPHADDYILYATYTGAKANEAKIVVLVDQKNAYNLRPISRDPSNTYLLDQAKFDGDNPLSRIKANTTQIAVPQVSLRMSSPQFISFSDNTRFIAIQSGQQFVVYDAEDARIYRYMMQLAIGKEQQAQWMDGHRLTAFSDGKVFAYDFDGTNVQNLVSGESSLGTFFDRDYKFMYTFLPQTDGKTAFQSGQLILN